MPRQSQHFEKVQDEVLINLVKEYPALYDPRHANYKESERRENIWLEISEKLVVDVDLCKKRWKYFRDTYVKYMKTSFKASGERTNKKSKFMYEDAMSFLWPFVFNRQNAAGVNTDQDLSCYPADSETEKSGCDTSSDTHSSSFHTVKLENSVKIKSVSPAHSTESGYRTNSYSGITEENDFHVNSVKSEVDNTLEDISHKPSNSFSEGNSDNESVIEANHEISEVHPVKSFFDAMAATVMTLPPHIQLVVKTQVFQIVAAAEQQSLPGSMSLFSPAMQSAFLHEVLRNRFQEENNSPEGT